MYQIVCERFCCLSFYLAYVYSSQWINFNYLLIKFKVALPALGQSYHWPSVGEVTLISSDKSASSEVQKTRRIWGRVVCIIPGMHDIITKIIALISETLYYKTCIPFTRTIGIVQTSPVMHSGCRWQLCAENYSIVCTINICRRFCCAF